MANMPPEIMEQLPPHPVHLLNVRFRDGKVIPNVCVNESGKILGVIIGIQKYLTHSDVEKQCDDIVSVQIGQSIMIQRE